MKRKINLLLSALAIFTMTSCGSNGANPPISRDDGDCVSIVSIELTSSQGLEDTYTITYSNNSTSTFVVTNGKDGEQGIQGEPGADGHTPTIEINEDGYWVIDGFATEILAVGQTGTPGKDGTSFHTGNGVPSESLGLDGDSYLDLDTWDFYTKNEGVWTKGGNIKGEKGDTPVIEIGENGNWFVDGVDTGANAKGEDGAAGSDGADGLTPYIGENGNWWIGENDTGVKAEGKDGAAGSDGADGLTPYIGENGNWWIGEKDTGVKAGGDLQEDQFYTITFDLNGGKFASDFDSSLFENIKSGSLVNLPYPYRENHTFEGWFISNSYKASEFTSSMPVIQNLNLKAKWNDHSTLELSRFREETKNDLFDDLYKIIRRENVTDEIDEQFQYRLGEIEFASGVDEISFVKEEVNGWFDSIKPDLTILAEKREEFLCSFDTAAMTVINDSGILKADFLNLLNKSFEKDLLSTESIKIQDDFDAFIVQVKMSMVNIEIKQELLTYLEYLDPICDILFANETTFNGTDKFYSDNFKQEIKNIVNEYKNSGLSDEKYYQFNKFARLLVENLANEFFEMGDYEEQTDFWNRCCNKLYVEVEKEVNQIIEKNGGYDDFYYLTHCLTVVRNVMSETPVDVNNFFDSIKLIVESYSEWDQYLHQEFTIYLNFVTDFLFEAERNNVQLETSPYNFIDLADYQTEFRTKGFKIVGNTGPNAYIDGYKYILKIDFDFNQVCDGNIDIYLGVDDGELARSTIKDYFETTLLPEITKGCTENGIDINDLEKEISDVREAIELIFDDETVNNYLLNIYKLLSRYDTLTNKA